MIDHATGVAAGIPGGGNAKNRIPQMDRVEWVVACVLLIGFAPSSGASPEPIPAITHILVSEKLGAGLAQALKERLPPTGVAVGVTLRNDDLPPPGARRRAVISARQQRVLDSLSAGSFRVRHRFESVSGLAGWAQAAAVDALLAHSESEFVYLDGTVHATLAEGSSLIGAP